MATSTVTVLMALTVVSNLAYGASTFLVSRPESGYTTLWEGWVQPIATVLPAVIAIVRAIRTTSSRLPWVLIASALTINVGGTLVLALHDTKIKPAPSPYVSDYFFLACGIILAGGIIAASHGGGHRISKADRLDSLIMSLAVGCIGTALWFEPLLKTYGFTAESMVGLGYPLLDIALLMVVASAVLPTRRAPSPAVLLFLVATVLWATADIIYMRQLAAGTYTLGTPIELLWSGGTALYAIATAFPNHRTAPPRKQSSDDALLPVLFAMLTLVVVCLGLAGQVPAYVAYLGIVTVAVSLARVSLTVKDLRKAHDAHREARVDELTNVLNRRGFFEEIEAALEHPSMPWVLAMIDLDGFKAVNDSLGHQTGDKLLTAIGERFSGTLPAGALLGRLGGDEFATAIPGQLDEAKLSLDRMLRTLDVEVVIDGRSVIVAASAGVASWPNHGFSAKEVLRCADSALYAAKKSDERIALFNDGVAASRSADAREASFGSTGDRLAESAH
jgi:diguanylate cyclase